MPDGLISLTIDRLIQRKADEFVNRRGISLEVALHLAIGAVESEMNSIREIANTRQQLRDELGARVKKKRVRRTQKALK